MIIRIQFSFLFQNPEDPSCISREDLSNLLIPCITAIADFCPFAVALALDKLTSDLKVAKIDSLILLVN